MTDPADLHLTSRSRRPDVLPLAAQAVLGPFFEAGILASTEAHLIATVSRLQPDVDSLSLLALAAASRGARLGHTCIDLNSVGSPQHAPLMVRDISDEATDLTWPSHDEWATALESSLIVAGPSDADREPLRPLVFDGQRIYLQRYWTYEIRVADDIRRRSGVGTHVDGLDTTLDALFATTDNSEDGSGGHAQRRGAAMALQGGLSIITGGPGTGKTYTIARILAAAHQLAAAEGRPFSVALTAPTGKAAARITESVGAAVDLLVADTTVPTTIQETATTIHALLGWAPGDGFGHNRRNPLPHDMVIVDETSMVSVSLMARLLEAVRPDASLVLVGDPDQLASVEVGTVLSDIIGPAGGAIGHSTHHDNPELADRITALTRAHRFGHGSPIAELAAAIQAGNLDSALELLAKGSEIEWVRAGDAHGVGRVVAKVVDAAVLAVEAALAGNAEAGLAAALSTKVLAATRQRRFGLHHWNELIEAAVIDRVDGVDNSRRWFVGRPVMITANDRVNHVANGDVGLVVARDGSTAVALPDAGGVRYLPTSRLAEADTWWAMTIHKSQGSEFDHVVVSLPPSGSPVLTRELLYTGITRARHRVTILADEASLREAIQRPVTRASGLRSRLWGD